MYNLRLLDITRKRIAVIDQLVSWQYARRPSEATEISVTLPREAVEAALPAGADIHAFLAPYQVIALQGEAEPSAHESNHERAQVAHFVEIYRGKQHVVTGRISKRDIKDETISIQCHTEEIELERHVTPAQYGRKWDHWDLADVARDMLRGWHVQRVKDKTQWESAIDSSGIDTSTEPGVVMLAKSGGKYVSQGHITLRFAKVDVPGFAAWDRIRWASDNASPVRTTMQYRYGDGTSMGAWSDEVEGTLPDEIGVVPGTTDAEVIDVRINLYTDDRESEDANGNPVGQTPFVFAVELIARTEGALDAGDIPASTGVFVSGLEADGASALNVLSQACEQAGWEFWVSDGGLHIAKQMGQDRTASVLLRAGTNMTVTTLAEGDDDLVNVLTAYGPGEGINRLQVTRRHEESIAKYGEYRGVQTFESATTLTALIDAADTYLEEHAAPIPAYRVEVHYPYGTEPEFGCGDYVRVADPRNGIVTRSRIAEETRSYSTSGLKTTLYLGMPAPNLARTVRPTEPPRPVRPPDKPVISVLPIPGGIRVIDTKAPNIRWATSEVHMSTDKGFVPSAETLVADGRRVRFDVTGLTPDMRYYVRLIRFDTDGNASEPSDEMSVVAGWVGEREVDPDLFSVQPSSEPPPLTGRLEDLWDMDPATGVTFASPPTITFKYPVDQGSDMVRVHISGNAMGYVQMRRDGHWVDVAGSAADPLSFQDGWNVKRFTDHKLYFGREYRIVFLQNVKVNELKFWRVTLADEVQAQVMTLTEQLRIETEDRAIEITDRGMRVEAAEGATIIRPGGIVFEGAEGRRTGYVRSVQMGTAEDGDFVSLPFQNAPIVLLSPAYVTTYDPFTGNDFQHLQIEARNVGPDGFDIWAKLFKQIGGRQRIIYLKTEAYQAQLGSGKVYCGAEKHASEASEVHRWSPHEVRSVGETVMLTTPAGTTQITVRMREMLHVHAYAARNATNRITYRLRARVQGSNEWIQTIGPITKSISVEGGPITGKTDWVHRQVNHVFSFLDPAVYEVQLEITDKQWSGAGSGVNNNDSCYLIVEEMLTRRLEPILLPEPMSVHYVALETDNAGRDADDSVPED